MSIAAPSVGVIDPSDRPLVRADALALAGAASVSAGAIHAAAMGAHSDHRQAVVAFALTAIFQVGWGALALARSGRGVAVVGVLGNAALVGTWVLAVTSGIPLLDGLEAKESIEVASASAAGFAALGVITALIHLRIGGQVARARSHDVLLAGWHRSFAQERQPERGRERVLLRMREVSREVCRVLGADSRHEAILPGFREPPDRAFHPFRRLALREHHFRKPAPLLAVEVQRGEAQFRDRRLTQPCRGIAHVDCAGPHTFQELS